MVCRRATYFVHWGMIEYYQKSCGWNSKTTKSKRYYILKKLCKIHYTKKSFLTVYVGTYYCYENIKIKFWYTVSILNPWHCRNF